MWNLVRVSQSALALRNPALAVTSKLHTHATFASRQQNKRCFAPVGHNPSVSRSAPLPLLPKSQPSPLQSQAQQQICPAALLDVLPGRCKALRHKATGLNQSSRPSVAAPLLPNTKLPDLLGMLG
jgi:hypothetical protein